jgi:CheY-like chemotaxis protein
MLKLSSQDKSTKDQNHNPCLPAALLMPAIKSTTTALPTPPEGNHPLDFAEDLSSPLLKQCISLPPSPPSTPAIKIRKSTTLGTKKSQRCKRLELYQPPVFRPCNHSNSCIRRMKVLLVDDNLINLTILSQTLRKHMSYLIDHLEVAKSGVKALELLKQRSYDLILLDIDMPILNGIETARHIRQTTAEYDVLACNRSIPILAVTTNDSAEWKRAYYDVGMVCV